jgi:hypothetical protein
MRKEDHIVLEDNVESDTPTVPEHMKFATTIINGDITHQNIILDVKRVRRPPSV